MYTRSYPIEEDRISEKLKIPENYDGVMLRDDEGSKSYTPPQQEEISRSQDSDSEELHNAPRWEPGIPIGSSRQNEDEESTPAISRAHKDEGFFGGILKMFPTLNIFSKDSHTSLPFSLGTEEILIIGIALFLFLSKGGDRECALMMLLLLFVK